MNSLYLIIIGVVDLITGIGGSLACLFFLASVSFHVKKEPNVVTENVNDAELAEQHYDEILSILIKTSFSVLLLLCILQILIAIFVLHSFGSFLISESHMQCRILKTWLIFKIVLVIILIASFILMGCAWGFDVWDAVKLILAVALNICFIIFISMFKMKLNKGDNARATYSAN